MANLALGGACLNPRNAACKRAGPLSDLHCHSGVKRRKLAPAAISSALAGTQAPEHVDGRPVPRIQPFSIQQNKRPQKRNPLLAPADLLVRLVQLRPQQNPISPETAALAAATGASVCIDADGATLYRFTDSEEREYDQSSGAADSSLGATAAQLAEQHLLDRLPVDAADSLKRCFAIGQVQDSSPGPSSNTTALVPLAAAEVRFQVLEPQVAVQEEGEGSGPQLETLADSPAPVLDAVQPVISPTPNPPSTHLANAAVQSRKKTATSGLRAAASLLDRVGSLTEAWQPHKDSFASRGSLPVALGWVAVEQVYSATKWISSCMVPQQYQTSAAVGISLTILAAATAPLW